MKTAASTFARIAFSIAVAFSSVACTGASPTAAPANAPSANPEASRDDSEASPTQADELARIITLSGHVTETVYALGLGERVVAVDASSTWPEAVRALPQLGYHRRLSPEGLVSLSPSLVLGTTADGPEGVANALASAGVPYERFEEITSIESAIASIEAISLRVGRAEQGARIVAGIRQKIDATISSLSAVSERPRVVFVYARGQGTLMVAGRNTAPSSLIEVAGGINPVDHDEYRPLGAEGLIAARPDVILIAEDGLASLGGVDGLLAQPGVAMTPAGESRRIVSIEDSLLLTFGPRLGDAVAAVAAALHPSLGGEGSR